MPRNWPVCRPIRCCKLGVGLDVRTARCAGVAIELEQNHPPSAEGRSSFGNIDDWRRITGSRAGIQCRLKLISVIFGIHSPTANQLIHVHTCCAYVLESQPIARALYKGGCHQFIRQVKLRMELNRMAIAIVSLPTDPR
jgi:hypothetical protein